MKNRLGEEIVGPSGEGSVGFPSGESVQVKLETVRVSGGFMDRVYSLADSGEWEEGFLRTAGGTAIIQTGPRSTAPEGSRKAAIAMVSERIRPEGGRLELSS